MKLSALHLVAGALAVLLICAPEAWGYAPASSLTTTTTRCTSSHCLYHAIEPSGEQNDALDKDNVATGVTATAAAATKSTNVPKRQPPQSSFQSMSSVTSFLAGVMIMVAAATSTTMTITVVEPAWAATTTTTSGALVAVTTAAAAASTANTKTPTASTQAATAAATRKTPEPMEKKTLDLAKASLKEETSKIATFTREYEAAKSEFASLQRAVTKRQLNAGKLTQVVRAEQEQLNAVIATADRKAILTQKQKVEEAKKAVVENTEALKAAKSAESKLKTKMDSLKNQLKQATTTKERLQKDIPKYEQKYKQYLENAKKQAAAAKKRAQEVAQQKAKALKQEQERKAAADRKAAEQAKKDAALARQRQAEADRKAAEQAKKQAALEREAALKQQKVQAEQRARQTLQLKAKLDQLLKQKGELIYRDAPKEKLDAVDAKIEQVRLELKALSSSSSGPKT